MAVPYWARMLHRVSVGAHVLRRAQEIVRDELLFAFLDPRHRSELTIASYSHEPVFLPGGDFYESGFFALERALLDHPGLPRRGRVLLGAAGAGRELRELVARGYSVLGFEPNPRYFAAASAAAAELRGARVVCASYDDLVHGTGALARLNEPFELVYLGFGSFSHLTLASERVSLLRRCRELAPSAPLLLTLHLRLAADDRRQGRATRFRHGLRRCLGALGAHDVPDGLEFSDLNGFIHVIRREDFRDEAAQAGYDIARLDVDGLAGAVLSPR